MEILLLRHATAVSKHTGPDFDRPLTAEGEREADRIGRLLAHRDLRPDAIVSSPAPRALQTAERAAAAMGIEPGRIVTDARIYEAGPLVLAEILAHAAARSRRPMLVGHNPGFEQLATRLGGLRDGWEFPKGAAAWLHVPDLAALRRVEGGRLAELLEP